MKFQNASVRVNQSVMVNLRKSLNRLPHLIAFEAASRKLNFTRAAEELGVSRVSVSRQIAELEESLGVRLFNREHRRLSLTQAGRALEAEVNPALHQIADALKSVAGAAKGARLSVTTTSAFATYWLMPRLVDFSNRFPRIELDLVVADRMLDLAAEGINVAVRYSATEPREGRVRPLLQEKVFPVVSPRYAARTGLTQASDLLQEHLLHLSGIYRPGARWPSWFRSNGLEPPPEGSGVVVNTYINMLQAAIAGQGVGLAGNPLVDPYLADGSLIRVPGCEEVVRDHYYLMDMTRDREDAQIFCNWIMEQAGKAVG